MSRSGRILPFVFLAALVACSGSRAPNEATTSCTGGTCAQASCSNGVLDAGEADVDCGGPCTPCADWKKCDGGDDCASGVCTAGACAAPTCTDQVKNGSETDVDCGGSCVTTCANGLACAADADCASSYCSGGTCYEASCRNGALDPDETDVDCGGACPPCGVGKSCDAGEDCASLVCNGTCLAPTCTDGVQNGTETDLDCGGGTCGPCAEGRGCAVAADCASSVCAGGTCAAPACDDGIQNGYETATDCGGTCPGCATGETCHAGADCQSGVCTGGACQAPACDDGVKNGTETGVDCGGETCGACPDRGGCVSPSDCASGVCVSGVCVEAWCTNGQLDANLGETGLDCGGPSCAPCPDGGGCTTPSDCASDVCSGGTCVAATCGDHVQNGTETAVDCGGACAACAPGATCHAGSDCTSGVCVSGRCAAPTCTDAVKNGNESDVDCGGSCPSCQLGKTCTSPSDCAAGACVAGKCAPTSCSALKRTSSSFTSGTYLIAPDRSTTVKAYCDMRTLGGGWTLVLKTSLDPASYPDARFQQAYEDWVAGGVGVPGVGSDQYVMPLLRMRQLAALRNTALRFAADGVSQVARLRKARLSSAYAITGQNTSAAAVASALCGSGAQACFLGAPFSAAGNDATASCVGANDDGGYWYSTSGACYSYDPFRIDDPAAFAGTTVAPGTQHWTWWMR